MVHSIALAFIAAQTPAFDAVSVKHSQRGRLVLRAGENVTLALRPIQLTGTRLTGHQTLHAILSWAYDIHNEWQIAGPDWLYSDFYQIDAVLPAETSDADARLMMQSMLADRFGLKLHRERREFSAYALVPAKGGVKLQEIPAPERHTYAYKPGTLPGTMRFEAEPGMQMASFAARLYRPAGRPVVDETGLPGFYKISLEWPVDPADRNYEGVVRALPQLGLKLEPKKAIFDVLVIDQVLHDPTPN